MAFSSLVFLFAFLPLVLLVYYLAPARRRNLVALAASCVFYAWGAPRFLFVLLGSGILDYVLGRSMQTHAADSGRKKALLCAGIALNLGCLLYFKYANFFVGELNSVLSGLGREPLAWTRVALPLAISFFTFQKLSYLVDVYRGVVQPASSLTVYLLYVTLFPRLIAGPIVRYHDIADQLANRRYRIERFFSGICRFCVGLGRKVLIADTLGRVADDVFSSELSSLPAGAAWIGMLCYSFQIYFDFAGYSDMAIGLGRMLGLEFLENFNCPYIARTFTDFWRRWHISLSNWMKEYLYVPLGGNRKGRARTVANLWIVFLLSGLWHGAAWTFIFWGIFHGTFLSIEKVIGRKRLERIPAWLGIPSTFLLVSVGWVFFRAETFGQALAFLRAMAVGGGSPGSAWIALLDPLAATALVAACVFSFVPAAGRPVEHVRNVLADPRRPLGAALIFAGCVLLLFWSACFMAAGSFSPFIYDRF